VGYLTYDDRFLYAGFEFFDPDRRRSGRPSAIGTMSRAGRTTEGSSSTPTTTAARPGFSWPTPTESNTTRSPTTAATARTAHRTCSGRPPRRSRRRAGPWRSACPSRRCATQRSTLSSGASCSTATTPAPSATRCSLRRFPAEATASSAGPVP
jgi:hypothetical protein